MRYYFDLDNTVFDAKHREHHLANTNKDVAWELFYREMVKDPLMPGAAQLDSLLKNGADLAFLSARPERWRGDTLSSLSRSFRYFDPSLNEVILRPNGDYSPASAWKTSELSLRHGREDSFTFVDDDRLNRQYVRAQFPNAVVMSPEDAWEMVRTISPEIPPTEVEDEDTENMILDGDILL